jgi:PPOX class probable F420-dependent enzyme
MAELPDEARKALEGKNFWHLATVNPDGSPQSTPIWVHTRNGKLFVNTASDRRKARNLDHNPSVALSLHGADNPYTSIQIQGRVVDRIIGDEAEADIDSLSEKYTGVTPYPYRAPGERRVTYVIEPTKVMVHS